MIYKYSITGNWGFERDEKYFRDLQNAQKYLMVQYTKLKKKAGIDGSDVESVRWIDEDKMVFQVEMWESSNTDCGTEWDTFVETYGLQAYHCED